ncbi:P-loop containing nucleoside triphosphate hydrolase protein, partial [Auriscalpium vulgare]
MPDLRTRIDWSERDKFDWTSEAGLEKLRTLVRPHLPFDPRPFQLEDSARILNGQDIILTTATGDGKSALIYIPALARKEMRTVVVEPTNALESDIASGLRSKGVSCVAINADTLAAAKAAGRDLWKEARQCIYQVVTTSPESLRSVEFDTMIKDIHFNARWGVLTIDEAHLVDDWGADFRKAYADIWMLRARGPPHLSVVAMSATIEKGRQLDQITHCLGFQKGAYFFDHRDCERRNVDYVFREAQFHFSGHVFKDLDWLIPKNMKRPSDLDKGIIYCDTIELGHRVTLYL